MMRKLLGSLLLVCCFAACAFADGQMDTPPAAPGQMDTPPAANAGQVDTPPVALDGQMDTTPTESGAVLLSIFESALGVA